MTAIPELQRVLRRLKKNIGRISQRFAKVRQELRRLFIQCKDLKTLTISTPRYV